MAGFSSAPVLIPSTSSSARSPRLMRATSALEYGSPVRSFLTISKRWFSLSATSLSPSSGSTRTAFRISSDSSNHDSGGNPMAFAIARSLSQPGFSILPLRIMLTYERVTTPPVASWSCWPFHRVPSGRRYRSRSNSNFWEMRNRTTRLSVSLFRITYHEPRCSINTISGESWGSFRVQSVRAGRFVWKTFGRLQDGDRDDGGQDRERAGHGRHLPAEVRGMRLRLRLQQDDDRPRLQLPQGAPFHLPGVW